MGRLSSLNQVINSVHENGRGKIGLPTRASKLDQGLLIGAAYRACLLRETMRHFRNVGVRTLERARGALAPGGSFAEGQGAKPGSRERRLPDARSTRLPQGCRRFLHRLATGIEIFHRFNDSTAWHKLCITTNPPTRTPPLTGGRFVLVAESGLGWMGFPDRHASRFAKCIRGRTAIGEVP